MNLVEAGYFTKAHGIKGALILKAQLEFDWEQLKVVFLEVAGNKAPYFIASINKANQGYILQLEQVEQIEKANQLLNKKLFIDEALVLIEEVDTSFENYEVLDAVHGNIGKVVSVSDNGVQKIIEVELKGKMVLLPMVDELIDKIDDLKKIIYYKAPEGLIELYLEEDEET